MTYNLNIPLPEGWTSEIDQYEEVENAVITHLQCHLPDGKGEDKVLIECYIGDMPSDTTAEDEAYANYADIISQSQALVITTAWPEFSDIRRRTDKPVVDCRYML